MSKMETVPPPPAVKGRALQDAFLGAAMAQRAPVTAHLRNGVKLEGRIVGFDAYMIVVESRGATQAVYKSALSTVLAHSALNLHEDGGPSGNRSDGFTASRNRTARRAPVRRPTRSDTPSMPGR